MNEYKDEIINTRIGCLGGSDAKLIQNIGALGYVPKAAYHRLAICNGLIDPNVNNKSNAAMRFGDFIEKNIFDHINNNGAKGYESNPLWVSNKFSKKNVKLICHPDIVLIDEENQTINVWEVKATRFNVKTTKETYRAQMFIEWILARELAEQKGRNWKVRVFLCHYDTIGIDIENDEWEFSPDRLSIHKMQFVYSYIDVNAAMNVIDRFLDGFTEFYYGDEIDSKYLPEDVKHEFELVTNILREIKEREKQVEDFKVKLYSFMCEKGIKNIKNNMWTISRIDEGETRSFDGKKYIEHLKATYPRKSKKIIEQFTKVSKRRGYVQIKLDKNNNENK